MRSFLVLSFVFLTSSLALAGTPGSYAANDPHRCFDIPVTALWAKEACYSRIPAFDLRSNPALRDLTSFVKAGDSPLEQVCLKGAAQMPDGFFQGSVRRCGTNFRIFTGAMDAPDFIIDVNGKPVASCGGMPGPNGPQEDLPACNETCEQKNLCDDVHIDCSQMALPAVIPSDYEGQIEYFKKKNAYKYLGLTVEEAVNRCQSAHRHLPFFR